MHVKDITVVLAVLCTVILTVVGHSSAVPKWKLLFRDYRKWTGYYQMYNRPHSCNINVASVQYDDDGGATVTFKADGAVIEMNVFSDNQNIVKMKKFTSYNHTETFPVDQDFQTSGVFVKIGSLWTYSANITQPKGKGFQIMKVHPIDTSGAGDGGSTYTKKDRSLSLGLAVGIPVTLAIILMFTGIGIGIWAIKKGYLRHVPRAYKNFRNSNDTPQVAFDKDDTTNVHI